MTQELPPCPAGHTDVRCGQDEMGYFIACVFSNCEWMLSTPTEAEAIRAWTILSEAAKKGELK